VRPGRGADGRRRLPSSVAVVAALFVMPADADHLAIAAPALRRRPGRGGRRSPRHRPVRLRRRRVCLRGPPRRRLTWSTGCGGSSVGRSWPWATPSPCPPVLGPGPASPRGRPPGGLGVVPVNDAGYLSFPVMGRPEPRSPTATTRIGDPPPAPAADDGPPPRCPCPRARPCSCRRPPSGGRRAAAGPRAPGAASTSRWPTSPPGPGTGASSTCSTTPPS